MRIKNFFIALSLSCTLLPLANQSATQAAPLREEIARDKQKKAKVVAPHTPKPGSAERKAILNAFRRVWLANSDYKTVAFVVPWIKVLNGWVYIVVKPQSVDEKQHYEQEAALLRLQKGNWKVVERMGGESDCDLSCLSKKYPNMPVSIYPKN